jgi:hypothetical protein
MKMSVLMSKREMQLDAEFAKILAKVSERLQALVSVEITCSRGGGLLANRCSVHAPF